jgi:hypothetical protein
LDRLSRLNGVEGQIFMTCAAYRYEKVLSIVL